MATGSQRNVGSSLNGSYDATACSPAGVSNCIIGCGPLVLRPGAGASIQVPKMSLRGATGLAAAVVGAFDPLTFSTRPSASCTLSKKHMYGLWRDSDPLTVTLVPRLRSSGVTPLRVSCVTPCDSQTYSRVRPFSSVAEMWR